ncbi:hypothetical protein J6590_070195 [Homalodisca vitripennis]|nr:hypothetical protein J6590_070195 [Homalodisca vitripennis]
MWSDGDNLVNTKISPSDQMPQTCLVIVFHILKRCVIIYGTREFGPEKERTKNASGDLQGILICLRSPEGCPGHHT